MRLFMILAIVLFVLANVTGIGYGLYLWGGVGLAFSVAAWSAFKVWITMVLVGFVSMMIGMAG
jgi:hypothetical protein